MLEETVKGDAKETIQTEVQGYRDITPKCDISPYEAKTYWDEKFSSTELGQTEKANDNEKEESADGIRTIEKDGFIFKIDELGRTVSAAGDLKITTNEKTRNMPLMDSVGKGYQLKEDQEGHLIARRFGAPDSIENLVPQDGKLNQGDYKKMENTLANAVNAGSEVSMKVEPQYEGDSHRPSDFKVTYTIDGEKEIVIFKNESGEKNA